MDLRYSVRRSRLWVAPVVAALGLTSLAGTGAATAGPAPTSGSPAVATAGAAGRTTVVLVLRPRDPAALRALATDRLASADTRAATLRRAAPPAAAVTRVTGWLAGHGFEVTASSPWAVTATGPATVAADRFGVALTTAGGRVGHRGALRVPAELAATVSGVVGLDERPVFRHSSVVPRPAGTLGASELREAYSADTSADGTGTTVATVQFSGWRPSDLTDYASGAGIANASPGALTPYVDTTQRPAGWDSLNDGDGDFEVALDQESLLATAPGATQRIYFAQNTLAGFETALTTLLTDVQNKVKVTALSLSWGACEQDLLAGDDDKQLPLIEQSLEQLVAAGVTVFAASGDAGAYDCVTQEADGTANPYRNQKAVDFPGSSPAVVSVGGTRLTHRADGWHETTWGPTFSSAGRHVGGGGGFSVEFPRPAWQVGIGGQFSSPQRGVPDIASAADPTRGFGVYQQRLCGAAGWCLGGGTSAGAPAQTGLFVAALAEAGRTAGIGDVHGVLYGNPSAFRDITVGSNGTYSAGYGWDQVTGLGSPRWTALGPRLLAPALVAPYATNGTDVPVYASVPRGRSVAHWASAEGASPACADTGPATAPTTIGLAPGADRATAVAVAGLTPAAVCLTAQAPVLLDTVAPTASATLVPYDRGTDARVTLGWTVTDDGPAPSWAGRFHLRVRRAVDGAIVWTAWRAHKAEQTIRLPQGAAYRLEAQATDRAGNVGAWAVSPYLTVPLDGWNFGYSRGWQVTNSSHAYGGHLRTTTTRGSSATATFSGSQLWLVAYTTPGSGTVWVNVDGQYVTTVDLYSARYRWRRQLLAWEGPAGTHTVRITATGRHSAAATGTHVWLDAIAAG